MCARRHFPPCPVGPAGHLQNIFPYTDDFNRDYNSFRGLQRDTDIVGDCRAWLNLYRSMASNIF